MPDYSLYNSSTTGLRPWEDVLSPAPARWSPLAETLFPGATRSPRSLGDVLLGLAGAMGNAEGPQYRGPQWSGPDGDPTVAPTVPMTDQARVDYPFPGSDPGAFRSNNIIDSPLALEFLPRRLPQTAAPPPAARMNPGYRTRLNPAEAAVMMDPSTGKFPRHWVPGFQPAVASNALLAAADNARRAASVPAQILGEAGNLVDGLVSDTANAWIDGEWGGNLKAAWDNIGLPREERRAAPIEAGLELGRQASEDAGEWGMADVTAEVARGLAKSLPKMYALHKAGGGAAVQALLGALLFGFDETGELDPVGAATGAAAPGMSRAMRGLANKLVSKGVEAGLRQLSKAGVQKLIQIVADQTGANVLALAPATDELVKLAKENPREFQRKLAAAALSNASGLPLEGVSRGGKKTAPPMAARETPAAQETTAPSQPLTIFADGQVINPHGDFAPQGNGDPVAAAQGGNATPTAAPPAGLGTAIEMRSRPSDAELAAAARQLNLQPDMKLMELPQPFVPGQVFRANQEPAAPNREASRMAGAATEPQRDLHMGPEVGTDMSPGQALVARELLADRGPTVTLSPTFPRTESDPVAADLNRLAELAQQERSAGLTLLEAAEKASLETRLEEQRAKEFARGDTPDDQGETPTAQPPTLLEVSPVVRAVLGKPVTKPVGFIDKATDFLKKARQPEGLGAESFQSTEPGVAQASGSAATARAETRSLPANDPRVKKLNRLAAKAKRKPLTPRETAEEAQLERQLGPEFMQEWHERQSFEQEVEASKANTQRDRKFGPQHGEIKDWGHYLEMVLGIPKPEGMKRPHAHHTSYKKGRGRQVPYVEFVKDVLETYDIDWYRGRENLDWAPNVKGQHTTANIKEIALELWRIRKSGGTREHILEAQRSFQKEARNR